MEPVLASIDAISQECEDVLKAMADHPSQEHYLVLEVRALCFLLFETSQERQDITGKRQKQMGQFQLAKSSACDCRVRLQVQSGRSEATRASCVFPVS